MREVFIERDLEGLARVLQEHPEAWKGELCILRRTHGDKNMHEGPVAHFAIAYGWTAAIKVLAAGGDPLDTPHPYTKRTPIFHAAHYGRTGVVLQLMKMGKALEENGESVLGALVKSKKSLRGRNYVAQTAELLIQAGQDPWQEVEAGKTLPVYCAETKQLTVCCALLQAGAGPDEQYPLLYTAWVNNLQNMMDDLPIHTKFLDTLSNIGEAPPLAVMTRTLCNWCDESGGSSKHLHWGRENLLLKLIEYRMTQNIDPADAQSARDNLDGFQGIDQTLAILEAAVLAGTTTTIGNRAPRRSL